MEAAPFAGVPDVYVDPSETARVFENVVLETCARRGDVAVSLGVSTLDACFAASRRRADISKLATNKLASVEMKNETVARLWTVFAREDAPLLARWLALRGSALDEPCLAFEAQREARETAAALAAAARAARALADAHPASPARARGGGGGGCGGRSRRRRQAQSARAAFDAAAGVSPRLAASALRRRDAFVLDAVSLEHLRRDLGIAPAWRDVPQHFGETFFVPAGCPRFAVAHTKHAVARWFFLSPGSASRALRLAHQSRFLASGHPERGDAFRVRAAVVRAAMRMETRVREESAWFEYAAARDADQKQKKKTTALAREAEETRGGETPSSMAFHEAGREPNGERDERDERDETVRDARGIERRTRDGFRVNPIVA